MQVKEIIERAGIDRETLRFYESKGLLPKAARTSSNYREFPGDILNRLHFIKTAQGAGFTLSEIRELIDLRQNGVSCRKGRDIAVEKRQELADKMKSLREMKRILDCFIGACESNGEAGLSQKCHLSFDVLASPRPKRPVKRRIA